MTDSSILFVPGIGMPDQCFGAVRWKVAVPSATWRRPGYGARLPVGSFDEQVAELTAAVRSLAPTIVVGVSSGATLALAMAMNLSVEVGAVIVHEPNIGGLEPVIDGWFREAAIAIGRSPSLETVQDFLDSIYGSHHRRRLPADWLEHHAITIADEIGFIPQFQPTLADLTAITVPVTVTVGECSAPERHRAAQLLGSTGATVEVIDGAGHLLPVEQSDAMAMLVRSTLTSAIRRSELIVSGP